MKSSELFSPTKIGNVIIPNRFMRSATYEGLAGLTGLPRSVLNTRIENLAKGNVGLIVPGHVYPTIRGRSQIRQCGMSRVADAQVWMPTVEKVHEYGSKIIFQINHGGVRCPREAINNADPIGCSPEGPGSREMTEDEIEETIDSFLQAAFRVQSIGADGVQIHAAHGYLISQFLSPHLNKRNDRYGNASVDNRIRFLEETVKRIREFTAPSFMISVKISGTEPFKDGVTPELAAEYVDRLRPFVDLFEISGGAGGKPSFGIRCNYNDDTYRKNLTQKEYDQLAPQIRKTTEIAKYNEAYNIEAAKTIHRLVPEANLALVGGLRSLSLMEELVLDGTVKLVSLSRPFLKQPHLVKDLKNGKIKEIGCNSCGICTHYPEPEHVGYRCHNYK